MQLKSKKIGILILLMLGYIFNANAQLLADSLKTRMFYFTMLRSLYEGQERKTKPNIPEMIHKTNNKYWLKSFDEKAVDSIVNDIKKKLVISVNTLKPNGNKTLANFNYKLSSTEAGIPLELMDINVQITEIYNGKKWIFVNNNVLGWNLASGLTKKNDVEINDKVEKVIKFKSKISIHFPVMYEWLALNSENLNKPLKLNETEVELIRLVNNTYAISFEKSVELMIIHPTNGRGQEFVQHSQAKIGRISYDFFKNNINDLTETKVTKFVSKNEVNPKIVQWPLVRMGDVSGNIHELIIVTPVKFETANTEVEFNYGN